MIGFSMDAADNDRYYFENTSVPACESCGLVYETDWVNESFVLNRPRLDASSTFDGALVVSERFRRAVAGVDGARFVSLPSTTDAFLLVVERTVAIDQEARNVRQLDKCSRCGRFTQIAGATPVFLPAGVALEPGFSATDLHFGSARSNFPHSPGRKMAQSPIVLVDPATAERMALAELRGTILLEIQTATSP